MPDYTREDFVKAGSSDPSELMELARTFKGNYSLENRIAQNPATPTPLLEEYAASPQHANAVAMNVGIPSQLAVTLATTAPIGIAMTLAQNSGVSREVLELLKTRGEHEVLFGITANPSTPSDMLDELAHLPDIYMKSLVAMNPNTSQDTFIFLASSQPSFRVVEPLLRNKNVGKEALIALMKSVPDSDIAAEAQNILDRIELKEKYTSIFSTLATISEEEKETFLRAVTDELGSRRSAKILR